MQTVLGIFKYTFVLFFGIRLSFSFAGVAKSRKRNVATLFIFLFLLFLQLSCWHFVDFESTQKLYPFIVHFPIFLYLVVFFKRKWSVAMFSVFSAYLCCQIPRWFGMLAASIFHTQIADYIVYSLLLFPTLFLIERYAVFPAVQIMEHRKAWLFLFGAIPTLYYIFDYAATVYTDLLYSGSSIAVQFIPATTASFYFVFVTVYYAAQQSRNQAERDSLLLHQQMEEAKKQISLLYTSQEQAAVYRHDLRHHFSLVYNLLSEGKMQEAKQYLAQAQENMDAIVPTRYCVNNTVNLILSSFAAKAKPQSISFFTKVGLPEQLPLPETELCAILSNALENAMHAAACVPEAALRKVSLHCSISDGRLFVYVENTCAGKVPLENGFPKTNRPGHGYGIKSIVAIVTKRGGLCSCETTENTFVLRIALPLTT